MCSTKNNKNDRCIRQNAFFYSRKLILIGIINIIQNSQKLFYTNLQQIIQRVSYE